MSLKTFEKFNGSFYEKIRSIAYNLTKDDRKFEMRYFGPFCSMVWVKSGQYKTKELTQEFIDACKDVIVEVYFSNIDIEWEDDSMYEWWENLKPESFEIKENYQRSPYKDKSIPYLSLKKEHESPHAMTIYNTL